MYMFDAKKRWKNVWRTARVIYNDQPDLSKLAFINGILWLALCRLQERETYIDQLTISPQTKLIASQIIDELLAEED